MPNMMNIRNRRGCKNFITIFEKVLFVFTTCVLASFTTYSYWTPPDVQTSIFHNFLIISPVHIPKQQYGHELKHDLFSFEFFISNCLKIELLCTYIGHQLSCRVLEFVSYWLLNKYMRLFVGFMTVMRAQFHLYNICQTEMMLASPVNNIHRKPYGNIR